MTRLLHRTDTGHATRTTGTRAALPGNRLPARSFILAQIPWGEPKAGGSAPLSDRHRYGPPAQPRNTRPNRSGAAA